jgi:hypothetical protein
LVIALGVLASVASQASAAAPKPVPTWSQKIDTPKRFRVLAAFGSAAVLDVETGLVWEQAPSTSSFTWSSAQFHCNASTTGGRRGWRLPTIQDLASLVDPNNLEGDPDIPPGHPFSNVSATFYWSATTSVLDAGSAWYVDFLDEGGVGFDLKSSSFPAWCVRGGQGVDPQ